jgi:hypothetical protein
MARATFRFDVHNNPVRVWIIEKSVTAKLADRRECLRWKIVSQRREQARRVYNRAVFEIKFEIKEKIPI